MAFEAVASAALEDEFDVMREKRREQLTGGALYNPLDSVYAKHIARIDAAAESS